MFKKAELVKLSKYAIIPAVLYCIPLLFFIKDETYTQTWLLYLGNALFLISLFIICIISNRQKDTTSPTSTNGWAITIISIVFSCVLTLVILLVLAPGVFHLGSANEVLQQTPAAITKKNTHGLLFMLFATATIGNFAAGTFATLIARGSSQKDQVPS
ncbi:MAG: hypothetical protein ACRDE8_11630 [Ginsengibacter sp.]